jgi:hypothetical protein
MKVYYQLIPEKVLQKIQDIEAAIKPHIAGYSRINLFEVISIVAYHSRKGNEGAPLRIRYIINLVPQGDKYLKKLIDYGIIERLGNAVPGKTSYLYRIANQYYSKYESIKLTDQKLIRRIDQARQKIHKEIAKSTRGRSEQIKYLKQLTISKEYRKSLIFNYMKIEQYNSILASAVRIQNGDIFYSVDQTSGRFHSNVTNMSKELRPYLRIQGQQLVNIDVKNCQPYLSTIILTDPGKVSWMTDNVEFARLLASLRVTMTEDVKKYISLVITGQLYEYLMMRFAAAGMNLTRAETKQQVLRILFARNRMPKEEMNKRARQIFIENFPTVNTIFSKVRGQEQGNKFRNFKRFAILLQRIESFLMLDVVLKRIHKELPGVIAITIHDSIMTGILTNEVSAVREIIEKVFSEFVGFKPVIKEEKGGEEEEEKEEKEGVQYVSTTFVSLN